MFNRHGELWQEQTLNENRHLTINDVYIKDGQVAAVQLKG